MTTPTETPSTPPDDSAEARLLQRRSRRLIGKEVAVTALQPEGADGPGIVEGPELVASTIPLPPATKRSEAKRARLLDAAELLFSKWGYTGVSIRDVTDLAGTRLGDVNYYFGSKQNLYFEVLRRRAEPLAQARILAIEAVMASNADAKAFVVALVDAYLMPAMELSLRGGAGWQNFFQLIGHITFSKLWPDEIMVRYFNAPAERFVAALRGRFPDASEFQCQAASLLIVGPVIYMLARAGRVETYANPAFRSGDLEALTPVTRQFVASGVCAVLGIT